MKKLLKKLLSLITFSHILLAQRPTQTISGMVPDNDSRLTKYYDKTEPGSTGYVKQLGTFPNLLYRIYL
jgi:hypothetical protein